MELTTGCLHCNNTGKNVEKGEIVKCRDCGGRGFKLSNDGEIFTSIISELIESINAVADNVYSLMVVTEASNSLSASKAKVSLDIIKVLGERFGIDADKYIDIKGYSDLFEGYTGLNESEEGEEDDVSGE